MARPPTSRGHRPATQGGGGDIHDVMATPFGVRLLVGDVMGTGLPANRTGLTVLNAWRDLAFTEPSLAGVAVRLHALIARSQHPERFVTAGVSEARDATGRFFPLAQVTAEAAGRGGDGLLDALVTGLEKHVGDRGCDDILLLLVTMRLSADA
jgi:serine phosphatase RsbU (regulator of sigma subunit)